MWLQRIKRRTFAMMHSRTVRFAALGSAIVLGTAFAASIAHADALLSGVVTSVGGAPMGGATVSAKADGATITTTVFSDAGGHYYFPPLPNGHYRVWAQALSFATVKSVVDLAANGRQNFTLTPLTGDYFQQLPGDLAMASLPGATPEDALLKKIVENNCTGCHQPNYPLQHRFDAAGWSAVLDLMKNVNVSGVYLGADHKAQGVIDHNQKELAPTWRESAAQATVLRRSCCGRGRPARRRASFLRSMTSRSKPT
jgi:hypothetical protein